MSAPFVFPEILHLPSGIGSNGALFCARDPLGIRPFYYHLSDRLFACGSELRQLLQHPNIRQDPNEGMAAEYLSN